MDDDQAQQHWDTVYGKKAATDVSWFTPHLERSLGFIEAAGLGPEAHIIDVGAGVGTLPDDLLARGYQHVTVLDISARAIEATRARLGERAAAVDWRVGDVTRADLPEGRYDLWHDRAVFHFLTDLEARRRYVATVLKAVRPGGHVIVATFGPEGPERCSGLDIVRYDPDGLHAEFGRPFRKLDSCVEIHKTPWGSEQEFIYCYCRRA